MKNIKTYSELIRIPTFEERFEYLKLNGIVGEATFGFDRWMNQIFYSRSEYKRIRRDVIVRDMGCDLACRDREIVGKIFVHHMNPITLDDIQSKSEFALNPEFMVCVSFNTHNAIHYGDKDLLYLDPIERRPGDTCPWKSVT